MKNQAKIALIAVVVLSLAVHAVAIPELKIEVGTAIEDQTLTVTVKSDGSSVKNVLVQFILNGGTPIYAYTDTNGNAVFKPPDPGTLKIIASKEGYITATQVISVTSPAPITPTPPPPAPGGGGGGGVTSGEDPKNVEKRETREEFLRKDTAVSYKFITPEIPVREIIITANLNAGLTSAQVELLKDTSKLVTQAAPGTVYKNVNIWVGTSGFATPKNIKEAIIRFRVENSWMSANNVQAGDISMLRWDTTWSRIEAKEISRDANHTYFEAKSNAFSPFAISAKVPEIVPTAVTPEITPTITPVTPGEKPPSRAWIYAVILIVVIAIVAYLYMAGKKKEKK